MKRVLLGSMSVGGGHNALRDSFVASLKATDPQGTAFEPIVFDSVDTRVSRFYESTVHLAPTVQRVVFDMGRTRWGVRLSVLLNGPILREAMQALRDHQPDVVVSTHFLLSLMFAKARRALGMEVRVVNAIPDYGASTLAFYPRAEDIRPDYVIAMDRFTHQHLVRERGIPLARTHLSGFVPRPVFLDVAKQLNGGGSLALNRRMALQRTLAAQHPQLERLDPRRKTLIFLGGSAWTSKTLPVIERLLATPEFLETVNVVVVSGKNEEFLATLRAQVGANPRFSLFGFVAPKVMAQLLALADFPVLGSLAPASMHELLEMRCGPLFLFHYIPGSEDPHAPYIREHEIGIYEPNPSRMVALLQQATGFTAASPELARLLEVFPARARAIRADHLQRARQLGAFLMQVGEVRRLPVPLPDVAAATEFGVPRESVS